VLIFFGIFLTSISLVSALGRAEPSRTELALGTICTITLYDYGKNDIYREIFDRIRQIENRMSVNIPSSDVSRINDSAGSNPVQVHEDVFKVIQKALYFAQASDGAFDPTVGPLVSLWGIGTEAERVPSQQEINSALALINRRDVELNEKERTVFLKRAGMALDLGAIAKGYAADEAAAIIRKYGIPMAIVDLGGNIIVCGKKKDKNPWRVGIQHPGKERGAYIGVLRIEEADKTIVTSAVNERYFEKDGKRYHHIFSPVTGYPAATGLLSVTIITSCSMDADALSTAAFVLGYEKGRALIESLPGTEAVFIFEDLSVIKTGNIEFN
jgi:thiamine biosynthesis lipoprotein